MTTRAWLLGVVVLTGCGPSIAEVVTQNEPKMEALRETLRKVQSTAYGPAATGCDKGTVTPATLDIIHRDQLTSPTSEPMGLLNLRYSNLTTCFAWFEPERLAAMKKDKSSGGNFARSVAQCLAVTHLLVAHEESHDREKGVLVTRFDLISAADQKNLCSFTTTVKGDASLGVEAYDVVRENRKTGEKKVVRSDTSDRYQSLMWTLARTALEKEMQTRLGFVPPKS